MLSKLQGLEPLGGNGKKVWSNGGGLAGVGKSQANQRQISPNGIIVPASAGVAASPYDEEFSTLEA